MIDVVNRQKSVAVDCTGLAALARSVLATVPATLPQGAITVAMVGNRVVRRLNRDYRGLDTPTDVLSFPAGDAMPDGLDGLTGYLGDIVISAEMAERQARRAGHTIEREMAELLIHGMLHLLGYDHETDQGEMDRLEMRLRRKLLGSNDPHTSRK